MPRITKPFRGQRPSKRLDLSDMRQLFRDTKLWCAIGIVTVEPGQTQHFEITDTCVVVDVVLQPSLQPVTCRLSSSMWAIPAVGAEVLVLVPDGQVDFLPTIIDNYSAPPTTQGPAVGSVIIVGEHVLVHDGPGGANPLPTLAEHNALVSKVNDLISKFNALTLPVSGATAGPPPPLQQETPASNANGTSVFQAK